MHVPRVISRVASRWGWAGATLAFVAGALCYLNALSGQFVFDDVRLIVNNEALRSTATLRQLFLTDLWGAVGLDTGYYRPLAAVGFRALAAAFGMRPEPFHAAGVLLHAATAALVFLFVRSLLSEMRRDGVGTREAPALAGALLFAVHPVHVEAVAWASGMMDVAATFFAVLFLVLHARGARTASCLALLAGLLFKESAIAAAPVAVLFDLIFRRVPERPFRPWLRSWSGMLGVIVTYLTLRVLALGYLGAPPGAAAPRSVVGAVVLVSAYAQKLIVPHPLNAVTDLRVPDSIFTLASLGLGATLAALAALVVIAARRGGVPLFALALVAVPLVPALAVAPMDPALTLAFAERYLYFPSVGLSVFVAYGLSTLAAQEHRRLRLAATAALAVVLALFAALTVGRNRVWHDELSLWSDTARKTPSIARVRASLGLALYRGGEAALARAEFARALRLDPNIAKEYVRTGVLAAQRGQLLTGILDFQLALLLDPSEADAHFNLAVAYQSRGWGEMAMASYSQALALRPDHAAAHVNLGALLAEAGRVAEAIPHLEAALRIDPADADARRNLARAYELAGRTAPQGAGGR